MNKKLLVLSAVLFVGSVSAMEQASGSGDAPKKVWEGRLRSRAKVVGFIPAAIQVDGLSGIEEECFEPEVSPLSHESEVDSHAGDEQLVTLDQALVRFEVIKKDVAAAGQGEGRVDLGKIEKAIDDCITLLRALICNRVCFGLDAEVENQEQCKEEHDELIRQRNVLKEIRQDLSAGCLVGQSLVPALQRQIWDIQLILTATLGRAYTDRDIEVKIGELERQIAEEPGNRLTPLRERFLSILKRVVEICEADREGLACNVNLITLCTDLTLLSEAIAVMRHESDAADVVMMADQVDVLTKLLEKQLPGGRLSDLMIERSVVFAWKVLVPLTMKLSQLCERKAAPYQLAADPALKDRGRRLSCLSDCCCGVSVMLGIGVLALVGLGYFVVPDASLANFLTFMPM